MEIGKIEKTVPMPEVHSKFKYPWPEMEAGDSVIIEPDKGQTLFELKRKVGPAARYYGQKTAKKFKTLALPDQNCVRVWRVE